MYHIYNNKLTYLLYLVNEKNMIIIWYINERGNWRAEMDVRNTEIWATPG